MVIEFMVKKLFSFLLFGIVLSLSTTSLSGCSLFSDDDDDEVHKLIEEPDQSEAELLNEGMSSFERNLFTESREQMEKLSKGYPSSYWASLVQLKTADTHFFSGQAAEALVAYEEFIRQHPKHEAIPYAQLMSGASHLIEYEGRIHDQASLKSAIKIFEKLLEQKQNNPYVGLAQKYLKLSRQELSKHEIEVAKFYIRQGMYASAASRLRDICSNYAEFEASKQAAYLLKYAFINKPLVNHKNAKDDEISNNNKENNE